MATIDIQAQEPSAPDRNGRIRYQSRQEQMKYLMRRVRGSHLPHYPEHEPKDGER